VSSPDWKHIPSEHWEYFEALHARVTQTHFDYVEYKALFYEDENIALLNAIAPVFFSTVQRALVTSIFANIRALTDPAKSRGEENLSFRGLSARLLVSGHPWADIVASAVEDYVSSANPVCMAVNKKIAHFDVAHAIGAQSGESFGIQADDVEKLIDAAAALLDLANWGLTIRPKDSQPGGAAELIRRLGV